MARIAGALKGVGKVGLDTNCIIYLLEQNDKFFRPVRQLFDMIESGSVTGITSTLALTEVLTKPYKLGDYTLANEYKILFKYFPNLYVLNVGARIGEQAAWLRAKYHLKTPDAIFVATALTGEAEVFVSNDDQLRKVREIRVVNIGDFI